METSTRIKDAADLLAQFVQVGRSRDHYQLQADKMETRSHELEGRLADLIRAEGPLEFAGHVYHLNTSGGVEVMPFTAASSVHLGADGKALGFPAPSTAEAAEFGPTGGEPGGMLITRTGGSVTIHREPMDWTRSGVTLLREPAPIERAAGTGPPEPPALPPTSPAAAFAEPRVHRHESTGSPLHGLREASAPRAGLKSPLF